MQIISNWIRKLAWWWREYERIYWYAELDICDRQDRLIAAADNLAAAVEVHLYGDGRECLLDCSNPHDCKHVRDATEETMVDALSDYQELRKG